MLSAGWEVTGHRKKTRTAAENTGEQPVEMGGKGILEGDSRKKWGGFLGKRKEKSWRERSH